MRFFLNGPNIPDQLLEKRDQGRVVFLCGAGVSVNSGMPNFKDLTQHVIDFFGPAADSMISTEFQPWRDNINGPKAPLDQIFNLLHQEYGREEVNAIVSQRLQVTKGGEIVNKEHSLIARLSANLGGDAQIITTNFDHLFEKSLEEAGSGEYKIYEPPAFPDLELGLPITGITYLHGRLKPPTQEQHPYILSSADLGRAYLSEGWATNFIRSLLKYFTVVLIGYQAEDPPVRYLLEGLSHDGRSNQSNLYAFDKGAQEDIEAKWRDRGVTAIAFEDYPNLWESIEAWAERADNPRQWKSNIIDLATKGPRQLSAHERGQVAHLVRTTSGAHLFSKRATSLPIEWLCVFDSRCRLGKKIEGYEEGDETFDPIDIYGLDDDPPRSEEPSNEENFISDDLLEWRQGDLNFIDSHKLCRLSTDDFKQMPPRLKHLSTWVAQHLDSPITAWWAMRHRLHPSLLSLIRRQLRQQKDIHPQARCAWNLILEHQFDDRNFSLDYIWFEIKDRIQQEGWTGSVLREFEKITAPTLHWSQQYGVLKSKPPTDSWDEVHPDSPVGLEVKFLDKHSENIEVSDHVLDEVFRILERHLRKAASFHKDLKSVFYSPPTCYENRGVSGVDHNRNETFSWFLKLFSQMLSTHPDNLRAYASTWLIDEKYYFRKLKLFAYNHSELFDADEVAKNLLELPQDAFWATDSCRELLFLINDRWEEFSQEDRFAIGERLLVGPDKIEGWSDKEYLKNKNEMISRFTQWLVLQNKDFHEGQIVKINEIMSTLPYWHDGWAYGLIEKNHPTVRSIPTDESPDDIIHLPSPKIIEVATVRHERDFHSPVGYQPFTGLVKANPRKALASLTYQAKRNEFPQEFWSLLIKNWPEAVSSRLYNVLLHRLNRLPYKTIQELAHPIGQWVKNKLLSMVEYNEELALNILDHFISGLLSNGGEATKSGVGEVHQGGKVKRSKYTYGHAINSPVGNIVEGIIHTVNSLSLEQGQTIPEKFKVRLGYLINAPGEGGYHTAVIIVHQINWLHYIDPVWTMDNLIPWFNFEHVYTEPAWNGYLSAATFLPQEVGVELKPLLLDLFPKIYRWDWGEDLARIGAQIIVELTIFDNDKPDSLSSEQARNCLRNMNDKNRQDVITRLSAIGQREDNGWLKHVIPFINSVWPRELNFRTSGSTLSWIFLLENTEEDFSEVLNNAVYRFLVPLKNEKHWLYRYSETVRDTPPLTAQQPAAVLSLLDVTIPNSAEGVPHRLSETLSLIEEANSNLIRDPRFLRLLDLSEQI